MPPAFASLSSDRHLRWFYVFTPVNKLPWAWEYRCLPLILLPLDMCLEVRSLENQPVLLLIRGYLPIPFDNRRAPLHSLLQSGLSSLPAGILAEVKCCILGMLACISLMTLELFHFPLLLKRFTLILSIFTLDCLLIY